jgi:hypothetical protein
MKRISWMSLRNELPDNLIDKTGDCWLWLGGANGDGYGYYKGQRIHRLMLQAILGRPLKGMALHSYGVRLCCNPEHLREGTHADNMKDMTTHGTHDGRNRLGEKHPLAKLTDEQRKLIKQSKVRGAELAKRFNVTPGCIVQVRGKLASKLSDEQKAEIKASSLSCNKAAKVFGVSASTIHNIRTGKYGH